MTIAVAGQFIKFDSAHHMIRIPRMIGHHPLIPAVNHFSEESVMLDIVDRFKKKYRNNSNGDGIARVGIHRGVAYAVLKYIPSLAIFSSTGDAVVPL